MKIEGACYCGAVRFSAVSSTPYPYMRCYCSFCRKTSGSGGYGINIMAQADSMVIKDEANLHFYHGMEHDPKTDKRVENQNRRYFCRHCGSPLWAADPRWPEWIYPFASSITTNLPRPPEIVHIMLDFAASWVEIPSGKGHRHFKRYPDESILAWHQRHGLYEEA
jgi:hypothetical protein